MNEPLGDLNFFEVKIIIKDGMREEKKKKETREKKERKKKQRIKGRGKGPEDEG